MILIIGYEKSILTLFETASFDHVTDDRFFGMRTRMMN